MEVVKPYCHDQPTKTCNVEPHGQQGLRGEGWGGVGAGGCVSCGQQLYLCKCSEVE